MNKNFFEEKPSQIKKWLSLIQIGLEPGFYFGMVLKHYRTDFLFSHVWGLWFRARAVQDRFRWKKWRFPRAFTYLLSKKVDAWQLKLSQSADMKNWLRFVKQILYVLKYV